MNKHRLLRRLRVEALDAFKLLSLPKNERSKKTLPIARVRISVAQASRGDYEALVDTLIGGVRPRYETRAHKEAKKLIWIIMSAARVTEEDFQATLVDLEVIIYRAEQALWGKMDFDEITVTHARRFLAALLGSINRELEVRA